MLTFFLIISIISLLAIFSAWPEIGLYLVAFCLPVIGLNFYLKGLNFPLVDLLALILLIAFVVRYFFQIIFITKNKIVLKWPLAFPFIIFLGISFISSLFSSQASYSLYYLARWPFFLYFAYIFLPYNIIKDTKILKKTIIAMVLGSFIVLISGFLSLYGQDWRDSFFRLKSISLFGIYLFGENQNLIAEYLNVGIFLILVLKFFVKPVREKRFLDLVFIIMAFGLILTFSRSGWITLFLQLTIYIWYYLRSKDYKPIKIILIFLGILILMSPLIYKMEQLQNKNASSTENRWLLTEIAVQAFYNKPYLGYGDGQFINLVDNNLRFKAKYGEAIDSHGMIQKVLAENGIFGLAAWLFILIYLFKVAYNSLKLYQKRNPWLLPLFLSAGGALFFQIFNTSYYKGKVWLPITLCLVSISLLEKYYAKKSEQSAK
ncbi:MAG: O-antigen ligase family protein [Patescibacteria group bacterium]